MAQVPGRFFNREMVGCEHSAATPGNRSSASSKAGSCRNAVAVLVAGGDHGQTEADDVGQPVRDWRRRPSIFEASREPVGGAEAPLNLMQRQHAASRERLPAVETGHPRLAVDR
ncbi:hypothetical protein Q7A36_24060 [Paracraurococcus sp. LOR1-02]|uniref:Uncharacterized protein n=1 Tax=Paracraurococcus lichenis TaxID=3064888 RepID=A0ABT9E5K6_9PROT|nr:hypothetical protein [Paracraurococcus sp. LOR1-02]MDO9711444.1 hypothetical protein [Paracraurococcus sp. LOR1-02]